MIDVKSFHSLSYGLFVIGALDAEGNKAGCVVNTFIQVTGTPPRVSVTINRENHTHAAVLASGHFTASVLSESTPMDVIGTFGFHSSLDTDKFATVPFALDADDAPYLTEGVCAVFSVKVTEFIDVGTHTVFIGDVVEAHTADAAAPMTYAYYHQVKGGKTPPKASAYNPEAADDAVDASTSSIAWRCTVCGHIEYADELSEDFVCPVCGVGRDKFERV